MPDDTASALFEVLASLSPVRGGFTDAKTEVGEGSDEFDDGVEAVGEAAE